MAERLIEPDFVALEYDRLAVLMDPPIGSPSEGDLGRDAEDLARRLNIRVYVDDLPGSRLFPLGQKKQIEEDYLSFVGKQTEHLPGNLESEGIYETIGLARSIGCTSIAAKARLGTLPFTGVLLLEPATTTDLSEHDNPKGYYSDYNWMQGYKLDQARTGINNLIIPEPTDQRGFDYLIRAWQMAKNHALIRHRYEKIFTSTRTRHDLLHIARHMPEVVIRAVFAQYSLPMPETSEVDQLDAELKEKRSHSGNPDTVEAITRDDTVHSSFDLRPLIAAETKEFIEFTNKASPKTFGRI